MQCWKYGKERHGEQECRGDKKDREQSRMVGEQWDLESGSKERNREVIMLGCEEEKWEDGKIEAILDTGCRGNVCGLR